MSSLVGTVVVEGFLPEKEAIAEELEGQPASWILTFPMSTACPSALQSYLTHQVFIIVCLQCIVHLLIGIL
jgi:hypothetical protein